MAKWFYYQEGEFLGMVFSNLQDAREESTRQLMIAIECDDEEVEISVGTPQLPVRYVMIGTHRNVYWSCDKDCTEG